MLWRHTAFRVSFGILMAAFLATALPQTVRAQDLDSGDTDTDTTDSGTDTTDSTTDQNDTDNSGGVSGVAIDANGVLRKVLFADPTGELSRQRVNEARATLDQTLARSSKLRKVSLPRLEAAVKRQIAEGRTPTNAMLHLAGLTRIQYVFFYPATNDIVIAGPAESWARDLSGRPVGLQSGRPVLELQDLVVALRAYGPNGNDPGQVFCSIDPTPEGLARMQKFLRNVRGNVTPNHEQFIVQGLRKSLGLQTITVGGVSPRTHFAQVMIEADYRMKLIGIGLERPPVKLISYAERANPAASSNAMQRWYFVPNYEAVRVAEDNLAMQLVGNGVKLVGENEVVTEAGERKAARKGDRASRAFTQNFTKVYPDLASKTPVYAQLRNLIDMLVATAFIQQHDYYAKAGWEMPLFGDEQQFPVETFNAPKQVATAVNSMWKGNRLMTPVGGGVTIEAEQALTEKNLLKDEDGKVQALYQKLDTTGLGENQWWWD